MRIVFAVSVAMLFWGIGAKAQTVLGNIAALVSFAGNEETVLVKDASEGGTFYHGDTLLKPDGGVVVPRKTGGTWVRSFDKAAGANPCWWGAKGDGKNDDLPALNAATAYCLKNEIIMQFPSGVFKVTGQWLIGGKTMDEKDLLEVRFRQAPSFRMGQHLKARLSSPIIIRGGVRTCIYGDFKPSKLTAIVYYNVMAIGGAYTPSVHLYTHEFSNIGIYAKGTLKGKEAQLLSSVDSSNKQIGLAVLWSTNPKIDGCTFSGLQYGLVMKTIYFGSVKNCLFEYCSTGMAAYGCNSNMIENIAGGFCDTLLSLHGSQNVVNNLNAEFCVTALVHTGGNTVFNGVYCENFDKKMKCNYQLVFGLDKTDTGYSKKAVTSGVVINALTLATGGRDAVLMKDDMRELTINGGSIFGNIITKHPENKVACSNVNGTYKVVSFVPKKD